MALGKKELTAAVVVGIAAVAAAVHFLVFQQKEQAYATTSQEYKAAVDQLANAEFIRDEQAFTNFQSKTMQYEATATSAVASLNLQTLDFGTSPPLGAIDQWASQTIVLLSQLNQRRAAGQPRLTFLEQAGWDLPASLPNANPAALTANIAQLNNAYRAMQASGGINAQYSARAAYNAALEGLGISARQVSYFAYPNYQQPQLYFNSETWITDFLKSSPQSSGMAQMLPGGGFNLGNFYNYYGLQQFGQAVPALKKIWMYALIRQALGANADPNAIRAFGEALEVGIPLNGPEPLNSINKQIGALNDLIDAAQQSGVQEIRMVKLMRPINIGKAVIRQPGATPPPAATPSPTPNMGMGGMDMMMMDMGTGMAGQQQLAQATPVPDAEKVGTGAGIELWMVGPNAGVVRFYYDLSHRTATYGIDDMYVYQQNNSMLTTGTIEVVTDVKLQGAGTAPVESGVQ